MRTGLALGLLFSLAVPLQAADPTDLARDAFAVLKANCYRCHGQDGNREGGFGGVLDPTVLRERKLVVPGDAEQSKLFRRVTKGQMPPPDESPRPTPADVAALKAWIDAGAPVPAAATGSGSVPSNAQLSSVILTDLERLDRRARRFQRYFTLAPLARAGVAESTLQSYRVGLKKLLNSLSWHPRIADLHSVDPAGLLLRLDLRDLLWDNNLWNRLLIEYPYGVIEDAGAFRAVAATAATRLPVVRADWFLGTASRPPLYYDLLQLPTTAGELERQLRIDAALDIRQERIARAGFTGSGVSRNNRLIERHVGPGGAYWRTYDFDTVPQSLVERQNLLPDRRNLFAFPLGPGNTDGTFQHAGGEVIFHLPNGLLGFMLVNGNDARVDKAPTAIVSDPRRPDRAVEPSVSCMSCHVTGILPKSDQVRDHLSKNPAAFSRSDAELIRALYPPESALKKLMEEDAERFRKALEQCGSKTTDADPVSATALRFEADLDVRSAAGEVGVPPEEFRQRIVRSDNLSRSLGALRVAGGTVHRTVFQQAFGDLAREFRLGALVQPSVVVGNLPDNTGDLDPLEGPSSQTNAAAYSPDRRLVLLASADRSVRLLEVATGRELRRFVGHAASVWAVAFSPDGRRALSGSLDGTVRLWDVGTGQEIRRLDGHTGLVSAVAFAPDGRKAVSAGFDHAVVLWDLDTGRELRRIDGWTSVLHSVAIHPDGRRVLIGGDPGLVLLDLTLGEALQLDGHAGAVVAVAFAADGHRVLSASDDGTARVWDAEMGQTLHVLRDQIRSVKSVAFSADGREVMTGGGDGVVIRWDAGTGQERGRSVGHQAPVTGIAISADGRSVLSAGRDASLAVWAVAAAAPESPPPENNNPSKAIPAPITVQRPVASVALGGSLSNLTLSPYGRWLYVLNRTDKELVRLDAKTLAVTAKHATGAAVAFALARDGESVFLALPDKGLSQLLVLDAATLQPREPIALPIEPFDLVAANEGTLYVSGGGTGWTDIVAVDPVNGSIRSRWGGAWAKSLLSLSPDGARLLVAPLAVTPARVESWPIPEPITEKPAARAAPSEANVVAPVTITPDSRFALCPTGTVLRLALAATDDLQPTADIGTYLAIATDVDHGLMFVLREDGTFDVLSYPAFQRRVTVRTGVVAFGAALDAKAGRLYVAGIPLAALRDRPRARGLGDVLAFDVSYFLPAGVGNRPK
jgi:WD40 repeat protein/mono/diheme cytochrome c family protein